MTKRLKILDFKTGEDHGYKYQLAHYALGLMDREKQPEADIVEVYLKTGKAKRYVLSYEEAAGMVMDAYERVLARDTLPHQINDYCGWCALKGHGCPAWEEQQQIATSPAEAPQILRERLEDILASPDKLGRFIVAYKAFKSLYEKLGFEDKIRELIAQGVKVPGLMTYERKGRDTIDPELFLQKVVPQMGTMRASTCITVSTEKAKEAWEKFSKEPFPVPVVPGPPITVLKEDRKQIQ